MALLLNDLTDILLKVIRLISFYAPVGFFGFFASLVATHGSDFVSNYARAIGIYYIVSVIYLLISSPLYARFGGGEGAAKVMFRHIFRPAATAFGTCSSVATIPVNMEVSKETGSLPFLASLGATCLPRHWPRFLPTSHILPPTLLSCLAFNKDPCDHAGTMEAHLPRVFRYERNHSQDLDISWGPSACLS